MEKITYTVVSDRDIRIEKNERYVNVANQRVYNCSLSFL
jgi:hypothetical protein